MTDFKTLAQMRRSHRKFTEQEIDGDDVKLILRAALMSPTSKGQRAWQFVVVDNRWLSLCWVTLCRTIVG